MMASGAAFSALDATASALGAAGFLARAAGFGAAGFAVDFGPLVAMRIVP
jgi:hypothetical protein